jgi:hypothetical protein
MTEEYINKYCIVRSHDQGIMAGIVLGIEGRMVRLAEARQLYTWPRQRCRQWRRPRHRLRPRQRCRQWRRQRRWQRRKC